MPACRAPPVTHRVSPSAHECTRVGPGIMGKPVIDTHTGSDGCTGYADTAEYDGHAGYTGYAGIRRGLQVEFAEGAVEPSKIHRGE